MRGCRSNGSGGGIGSVGGGSGRGSGSGSGTGGSGRGSGVGGDGCGRGDIASCRNLNGRFGTSSARTASGGSSMRRRRFQVALVVLTVVLASASWTRTLSAQKAASRDADAKVLAAFKAKVDAYDALRKD